jgi:hypothetical protein
MQRQDLRWRIAITAAALLTGACATSVPTSSHSVSRSPQAHGPSPTLNPAATPSPTPSPPLAPLTWSTSPSRVFNSGAGQYWVSCNTATFCVAIDDSGNAAAYSPSGWSSPTAYDPAGNIAPGAGFTYALTCTVSLCLAADSNGIFATSDGRSWALSGSLAGGYVQDAALSCYVPTFCLAVEDETQGAGPFSQTFDGSAWSRPVEVESMPGEDEYVGGGQGDWVSCPSSQTCVALGIGGFAQTWESQGWGPALTIDNTGDMKGPGAVSCPSVSFCIAVDGHGDVARYDGSSWSAPQQVDTKPLNAVSCPTVTFCVAVDDAGGAVVFDGAAWSSPALVSANPLLSVTCPTVNLCLAIDDQGQVFTLS